MHLQFWEIKQNHFDTVASFTYLVALIPELTRRLDFIFPERVSQDYVVITQEMNRLSPFIGNFSKYGHLLFEFPRDP